MKKPKIFAVCGKGGVGKTSISAILTKILTKDKNKKALAIDADPAIGLATSLGFRGAKTIDSIRSGLIKQLDEKSAGSAEEINERLDYELLEAIEERENLAFLSIGRPEKEGCYCRVNSLLRDLIASISQNFDYVIIDGEAGVEQVNRRVMETVTHLTLISDGSKKSLDVAETIAAVAEKAVKPQTVGVVFNRIKKKDYESVRAKTNLDVLGWIPENETIRQFDIEGKSLLELDIDKPRNYFDCLKKL